MVADALAVNPRRTAAHALSVAQKARARISSNPGGPQRSSVAERRPDLSGRPKWKPIVTRPAFREKLFCGIIGKLAD
jgi:hypothetical protein